MQLSGELVDWNDARGFGFILGSDGARYFVHIKSINRMVNRPRVGDRVRFTGNRGIDGRLQAKSVIVASANPMPGRDTFRRGLPTRPMMLEWRMPIALLLAALIVFSTFTGSMPLPVALIYFVMSVLSFLSYADDKRAAESGRWRISETQLLGVDLLFGIVGGLLGQRIFRHKTRKPSYVAATLLLATVHLLWLSCIAAGLISVDDILGLIGL